MICMMACERDKLFAVVDRIVAAVVTEMQISLLIYFTLEKVLLNPSASKRHPPLFFARGGLEGDSRALIQNTLIIPIFLAPLYRAKF